MPFKHSLNTRHGIYTVLNSPWVQNSVYTEEGSKYISAWKSLQTADGDCYRFNTPTLKIYFPHEIQCTACIQSIEMDGSPFTHTPNVTS